MQRFMKLRFLAFVFSLLMSDTVFNDEVRQLQVDVANHLYAAENAETVHERQALLQATYDMLKEIEDRYSAGSAQVQVILEGNLSVITSAFVLDRISSVMSPGPDPTNLREILGREPSPSETDENGWTDLHYAAALNLPNLARTLIDAGANFSARLESDEKPLSERLQKLLGDQGVVTDIVRVGYEPLHIAAMNDASEVAVVLIGRGADIGAKDGYGWTPLHNSAFENALAVSIVLIERGANMEAKDRYGYTPLHASAERNALEVMVMMIERGADINTKDLEGWTPLHWSVAGSGPDVAAELLDRGADFSAQTNDGKTAMDIATNENSREVLSILRKHQETIQN